MYFLITHSDKDLRQTQAIVRLLKHSDLILEMDLRGSGSRKKDNTLRVALKHLFVFCWRLLFLRLFGNVLAEHSADLWSTLQTPKQLSPAT